MEQMHFAKFSLFPAMYQHQKVRALECMFRGILEKIWASASGINHPKLKFEKITDFLRLSDGEFLALAAAEPLLKRKIQLLQNRNLLRRALHISATAIEGPLEDTDYSDLVKLGSGEPEAEDEIRGLRQEILDSVPPAERKDSFTGEDLEISDVWLDIPEPPKISKDIQRCYVNTGEAEPKPLRELFPIDSWLKSYADNKWTAHVFGYPDNDHLKALNLASIKVLQDKYRLKFSPRASLECKL